MSGSRVHAHGDAAHAPLAALHHGTPARVDLLLFVIVSHARGTTHVRHVASAARHGRPPHPRPLRAVARTPLGPSAAAVGVRGPCPRTATWPMRHRRRAGSADRTWPPGSHRVTRSDVGPGHPRPGAHAQTPQRALVDALARREDADGPVPGRICDAHSTHAHSVSQNLHGTANTHRRGPTREPPRDRHARRAATASRPTGPAAARGPARPRRVLPRRVKVSSFLETFEIPRLTTETTTYISPYLCRYF